jgi:hypothetical protein
MKIIIAATVLALAAAALSGCIIIDRSGEHFTATR